jgi:hypothetical protein
MGPDDHIRAWPGHPGIPCSVLIVSMIG